MSIVQSAPTGWEFQYTATALIGLARLRETGLTLFVDPKGGEDAELILNASCGNLVIEIQTKSSKSDVNSSELADFLAHFPAGQATNNLLARLIQDQNRVALFIVAGRCSDATRGFLAQVGNITPHSVLPVSPTYPNVLIGDILEVYHSKTPSKLDVDRYAFCQSVAAKLRIDSTSIANALRRVLIWEQVQKESLEQRIEHVLSHEYFVPTSRSRAARLELVEAVRLARDQSVDAIPMLNAVAAKFAGTRLLVEEHLHRGLETSLFDELKSRRVLLLTGQSMCGKSQTARYLAEEFQKAGFTCEIGNDVHGAIRAKFTLGSVDTKSFLKQWLSPHSLLLQSSSHTCSGEPQNGRRLSR